MEKKSDVLVSVLMGSDSDLPIMKEALEALKKFGIPYELYLTSAHRTPERTKEFALKAESRGVKVLIVGAGAAAHLAGVIASLTRLPVIGVPIDATSLGGLDALLSTVQMPGDPRGHHGDRKGGRPQRRPHGRTHPRPERRRAAEEAAAARRADGPRRGGEAQEAGMLIKQA